MADKTYKLTFNMSDDSSKSVLFTVPQGPKGDTGATGPQGPQGETGAQGPQGVGIASVKQTTTSTADDGNNVITVTLTDGTTFTFSVQNGSKGATGTVDYSRLASYLPLAGGAMTGSLVMGNNVPIYVKTAAGGQVLFGTMNTSNVMGIGSTSYPLVIRGSSITLDNLKVTDAAGARNNLAVLGRPVLLWEGSWVPSAGSTLTVAKSGGSAGCTGLGNLSEFVELEAITAKGPYIMPLYNSGATLVGGMALTDAGSGGPYGYGFEGTVSGNKITSGKWMFFDTTNMTSASGAIIKIIGKVRPSDIITA